MQSATNFDSDPLLLSSSEVRSENSRLTDFNNRERATYNKKVSELNEALSKLNNTEEMLNSVKATEPLIQKVLQLIDDTKQITKDSLDNNLVMHKEQAQFLTSYYQAIQETLSKNMDRTVTTQDGQLRTLQEILKEYKIASNNKMTLAETEHPILQKMQSLLEGFSVSSTPVSTHKKSTSSFDGTELLEEAKDPALAGISAISPMLGMLTQSVWDPLKQIGSTAKGIVSGGYSGVTSAVESTRKVGSVLKGLIGKDTNNQVGKNAKEVAEKKEKKETNRHVTLINKLDEIEKTIKRSGGDSEDGESNWLGTALKIGAAAGAITLAVKNWDSISDGLKSVLRDIKRVISNFLGDKVDDIAESFEVEKKQYDEDDGFWTKAGKALYNSTIADTGNTISGWIHSAADWMRPDEDSVDEDIAKKSKAATGSNVERAKKVLKELGYNDTAAAGILGNIQQESGFNPEAANESGHTGLFQWSKHNRLKDLKAYAAKNRMDWSDVETQIRFAAQEEGGRISPEVLNKMKTAEEAAWYVNSKFERSGESLGSKENQKRMAYARKHFDSMQDVKLASASTDSGILSPASVSSEESKLRNSQLKLAEASDNKQASILGSSMTSTGSAISESINKKVTQTIEAASAQQNQNQPSISPNTTDPSFIGFTQGIFS